MSGIASSLLLVAGTGGAVLGGLIVWQLLTAIVRLVLAWHTPAAVGQLLDRLGAATRAHRSWEPELRALRLRLPWPWPWRLERAAQRLTAGMAPGEVLARSRLLPAPLRDQAAQALAQGPEAFSQWCIAVGNGVPATQALMRQGTSLLVEFAAVLAIVHFLSVVVFPKWQLIARDLGTPPLALLRYVDWFVRFEVPVLLALAAIVVALAAAILAWNWRQRRRFAAARLLLVGSLARLPEAGLGTAGDFASLCHAAGWQADSPTELARVVARAEIRQRVRASWLPAICGGIGPLLLALPVGALVIGTMQMLIAILMQIEASS